MNRNNFLKKIFFGAASVAVAPLLPEVPQEPVSIEEVKATIMGSELLLDPENRIYQRRKLHIRDLVSSTIYRPDSFK